eukprot:TRINITY_DN11542_c0_g1_i14.p1 TRINITY_DN11542_c0_g1~~TRINITY_DN11542_c0_g1_i14.p1  ORF type:complete len:185 (+),score=38.81 TRINITY_DN11542_c0_g1_i14:430-984(+)
MTTQTSRSGAAVRLAWRVDGYGSLASWLSLSVSISALLSLDRPDEYIAALAQLMEEWEFHYANGAVQLMKRIGSKMQGDDDNSTEVKPRLQKRYKFLQPHCEGAALDPGQVVVVLCEILSSAYQRMDSTEEGDLSRAETVLRVDEVLQESFFGVLSRGLNGLAEQRVQQELMSCNNLLQAWERK